MMFAQKHLKVKELIKRNRVYIFSSNYALYGDISRRVMKVLKTFSPKVEIYSIDELVDVKIAPKEFKVDLIEPPKFQLNKFFSFLYLFLNNVGVSLN